MRFSHFVVKLYPTVEFNGLELTYSSAQSVLLSGTGTLRCTGQTIVKSGLAGRRLSDATVRTLIDVFWAKPRVWTTCLER